MTSKRIAHDRQQKSDKSQESGILQRAAVRLVADAGMQSTDDKEALTLSNSAFSKDFSRVPISTTKPQQFQPRNSQSHLMPPIQAKLTIGEPGDRYEQEADRVASEVVQRINAPALAGRSVQRQEEAEKDIQAKPEITTLQRMKEPKEELQAKLAIAGGEASTDLESTINRARGSGQPLEAGLQRSMGQAMGAEFSGVRVHTDTQADHLNQSIQAKAFTTGQDVFFRQGKYNHSSRGGQELIAHELTHVVQQTGAKEVISREGNVSIRSDNNYQYGKIIQCELDGSSSNAQAYSYGLIHGQYWPETNRADGHVNPGNANAGLELNHLKQVVNDLLQAMTTRESAGGPTGSIELHPQGAAVVKIVVEMLGATLGNSWGVLQAKALQTWRKNFKTVNRNQSGVMDIAIVPEHLAWIKVLEEKGVNIVPIMPGNQATTADNFEQNILENTEEGRTRRAAYKEWIENGQEFALTIKLSSTQLKIMSSRMQ